MLLLPMSTMLYGRSPELIYLVEMKICTLTIVSSLPTILLAGNHRLLSGFMTILDVI